MIDILSMSPTISILIVGASIDYVVKEEGGDSRNDHEWPRGGGEGSQNDHVVIWTEMFGHNGGKRGGVKISKNLTTWYMDGCLLYWSPEVTINLIMTKAALIYEMCLQERTGSCNHRETSRGSTENRDSVLQRSSPPPIIDFSRRGNILWAHSAAWCAWWSICGTYREGIFLEIPILDIFIMFY